MLARVLCAIGASALVCAAAHAQTATGYPRKAIRVIVPFAAGGPVDIIARGIAPRLGEILGQQLVVDNRGGAGSVLGTEIVASAAPDGYTLAMVSGSFTINPAMLKKLPYDSLKDFSFIGVIADVPTALVITASLPARNMKEFIALAKARPGELNFATPGRGTLGHLGAEWFSTVTGIRMVHVAYKGVAPALVDLMTGQVQVLFAATPGVLPATREGKLRMLAQGGKTRAASAADVPTFIEAGVPGFQLSSNFGLVAPAATPHTVIERLNSAVRQSITDAQVLNRLASQGAEPVGSTPQEHAVYTQTQIAKWIKVARQAGILPE